MPGIDMVSQGASHQRAKGCARPSIKTGLLQASMMGKVTVRASAAGQQQDAKMTNPLRSLPAGAALAVVAALAMSAPTTALADDTHHPPVAATGAAAAADMVDAEIRKIDLAAGKVTLKHGEIKNLDMPGMTMVFVVKDKALLDKLKAGDKVKFKAINDAGTFTVTDIVPLR